MEKYLNIGNLFDGGIGFSVRHTNEQVRAGTHAINSHDELVAMSKELLVALEEITDSFTPMVNPKEWYRADVHKRTIDTANAAIAKAKGITA